MSQSIVISSNKFDGKVGTILFNPVNTELVINLGEVSLPLTFEPYLLDPPQEIYGFYTITVSEDDCTYYLKVPKKSQGEPPVIVFEDVDDLFIFEFMDSAIYQFEG